MKTRITLILLSCFIMVTANAQKDVKANISGLFAAMDAGQVDIFGNYTASNFQLYHPFLTEPVPVDVFKGIIQGQKTAFPDMQHEILDILVEKDKASARGIFKGTNTGSMQGNPSTGNKVILPFIVNYDLDNNGKIKNQYVEFNVASFNAQLMKGLPPMGDPSVESAKVTIRNAYDALNHKDWNAFAALCDEKNYTDVNVAPTPFVGVWNAVEAYKEFFNAFTDFKIVVNEIGTISPTRYLVRVTLSGKHTGTLMGIPATGKMIQYNDCDIVEVNAQGKIIHHEPTRGGAEVFRQIGVDIGSPTIANKQLVSNIMSELNMRNLDEVINNYAADARFHGWAPQAIDVNGYKAAMGEILKAFPDSKFQVLDLLADGDKVVVRHQLEGTHTGAAFQGIAVTNKKVIVPATVTLRFANGKVVEGWLNADFLGLMMQLNPNATANK